MFLFHIDDIFYSSYYNLRHKKLLDDLKDRRGYSHLEEEALDCTMWRHHLEETLDLSSDRILNE